MVLRKLVPAQPRVAGVKNKSLPPFGSPGSALLVSLAVISYLISPVVSWIATSMLLAGWRKRGLALAWNFLAFLPMAVTINSSKEIINDWGWYTRQFLEDYPSYGLLDIFEASLFPENQGQEPLYYGGSWLVAQIFPGDIGMLTVLIVAFVYGLLSLATVMMSRELKLDSTSALTLQYLLFGFGMTFTLVAHLVRQSMAVAVLTVALAFVVQRRLGGAALAVLVATLIHTPAIVLGFFVLLAGFACLDNSRWPLFSFPLIGLVAGLSWWLFYGNQYEGQNDGRVSLFVVVLDLAILAGLMIQIFLGGRRIRLTHYLVASVMLLHLGFVLGIIFEPLPALRFYLYLTPISAVGAFLILHKIGSRPLSESTRLLSLSLVGLATVLSMSLRIASSPFEFEQTFSQFVWVWPMT